MKRYIMKLRAQNHNQHNSTLFTIVWILANKVPEFSSYLQSKVYNDFNTYYISYH